MRRAGTHRRFRGLARKAPAIDGPKAKAAARNLLRDARTLDNLTAESLANSWGLRLETAEAMLIEARAERERHG